MLGCIADEEVSLATRPPASTQASIPDSPRSSTLELSTRLSTAHSALDDEDDHQTRSRHDDSSMPQTVPPTSNSSLTQHNLDAIAGSSASKRVQHSASVSSQAGSISTMGMQNPNKQVQSSPQVPVNAAMGSSDTAAAAQPSAAAQELQSLGHVTLSDSTTPRVGLRSPAHLPNLPQHQQQQPRASGVVNSQAGTQYRQCSTSS